MTHPKIVLTMIAQFLRMGSLRIRAALTLTTLVVMIALMIAAATTMSTAQTLTTLHSFNGMDGSSPWSALVQGLDGNLYGTTYKGGANGSGTVFKITPRGTLTKLYDFSCQANCTYGLGPTALVQASDRDFYGATGHGGANDNGMIFKISPGGALTTLYNFPSNCVLYCDPSGLIEANDGQLYGTTASNQNEDSATVFKMTPSGTVTTLATFDSNTDMDSEPKGVTQATDGNFYGVTTQSGADTDSYGTVFKMTPAGTLTILHYFCGFGTDCRDGVYPNALVQAVDGNLYGTTQQGEYGTRHGTIFRITPSGNFKTLHRFCSISDCPDGAGPTSGLVQGSDGNLYGTTPYGGLNGNGTFFRISPGGALETLYSFCPQGGCGDGGSPLSSLVQDTNGNFYGSTSGGGVNNDGTIFSVSVGLGPFVRLQSTLDKVGTSIRILGQGLTGTTAVSFNGTSATFRVWSDTYLAATVPSGATTGSVTVTTPTGTLTSNQEFRVHPVILGVSAASGAAGTPVVITGTSFTQTTKVTFGGGKATASFTVDSDSQVTAIVPAGAPSGYIVLTTAGGRSRSPNSFTVAP